MVSVIVGSNVRCRWQVEYYTLYVVVIVWTTTYTAQTNQVSDLTWRAKTVPLCYVVCRTACRHRQAYMFFTAKFYKVMQILNTLIIHKNSPTISREHRTRQRAPREVGCSKGSTSVCCKNKTHFYFVRQLYRVSRNICVFWILIVICHQRVCIVQVRAIVVTALTLAKNHKSALTAAITVKNCAELSNNRSSHIRHTQPTTISHRVVFSVVVIENKIRSTSSSSSIVTQPRQRIGQKD